MNDGPLIIAGKPFHSRLMVGTGKHRSAEEQNAAIEASGADKAREFREKGGQIYQKA